MNKSAFLLLLLTALFSSCSISKNTVEEQEKPSWVQSRPIIQNYYIGIGSSSKKGLQPASYTATAKQNALSDLSSEISVTIESTSVLNTMSLDDQFSQQFVNDIKTSNSLQLESYELVATWEDAENYWVYYQLSKSKYQEWKEQKKEQAIADAKNKYLQGCNMLNEKLHFSAFQFYTDALSQLMPYFNESTICNIEGQSVDLGITIYNAMIQWINGCIFDVPSSNIDVTKGIEINNNALCFTLKDATENIMSNIPVQVNFSGLGLLKNSEKTGSNGQFCCSLKQIKSINSQATLSFAIDLTALSRISSNFLVRNVIKNIPVSETTIRLEIQNPGLRISGNASLLTNHFKNLLSNDFDFSKTPFYQLEITSEISQKERYNNLYYIDLECVFVLNTPNGNNIYRKRIKEEYSGTNWEQAAQNGYSEVMKTMERSIKREIINCIQ